MKNAFEEHETASKRVFERKSINKINLKKKRKIEIEFQKQGKLN